MESRSGIVAVLLLVLGGCGGNGAESLFGAPADSGAGGEDPGGGGSGASAGRSGSAGNSGGGRSGGSAGSQNGGGKGGAGKGGGGKGGTPASGGTSQGGADGGGRSGAESGGSSQSGGTGDGGSSAGSEPGGRGAGAGDGGAGGKVGADCDAISAEYQDVLEDAQVCDADSNENQCTEQVPSDFGCGCGTFVNPKNEEAVARLEALQELWIRGCEVVACPAIACLLPKQGTCTSSGSGSGHCVAGIAAQ